MELEIEWAPILALIANFIAGGFFAMLVVQVLKRVTWPNWGKIALSLAVSLVVGLAVAYLAGDFGAAAEDRVITAEELIAISGATFAGATAFYKTYFSGTAWMQRLGEWWVRTP